MHAAGAEIIGVHARARGALIEHHQLLAFLEAPERRRQRAHIHRLRGDVQQMIEQPPDLGIEHADILRARRHRHAEQLLDRERESVLLIHRRDVIEPVEIGHRLHIGLVLDEFFGAPMQQSDMRIDALDDLAVELQHQTQHAMGRGMLRPEIDREGVGRRAARRSARSFLLSLFVARAGCRARPPRARGNRNRGIPGPAEPAHRRRVSARRRSAPRHSR